MSGVGTDGLCLFCGLVGFADGGFGLWRMRQRPAKPLEEQAPFLALPRTTPLSTALDPRAGEEEPRIDFGRGLPGSPPYPPSDPGPPLHHLKNALLRCGAASLIDEVWDAGGGRVPRAPR